MNGNFMSLNKDAGKLVKKLWSPEPVMTGTLPAHNSETIFHPKKTDKLYEMKCLKAESEYPKFVSNSDKKSEGVPTAPLTGSECVQSKLEKVSLDPEVFDISSDDEEIDEDVFANRYFPFSGEDWRYNISNLEQILQSPSLPSNSDKFAVLQKKVENVSRYLNFVRKLDKKNKL